MRVCTVTQGDTLLFLGYWQVFWVRVRREDLAMACEPGERRFAVLFIVWLGVLDMLAASKGGSPG